MHNGSKGFVGAVHDHREPTKMLASKQMTPPHMKKENREVGGRECLPSGGPISITKAPFKKSI